MEHRVEEMFDEANNTHSTQWMDQGFPIMASFPQFKRIPLILGESAFSRSSSPFRHT